MKKGIPYLVLLFVSAVFAVACSSKLSASSDGTRQLTVMSYNIHHANPPSEEKGVIKIDSIVNVIRQQNPDLVALQEVDVNTGRSGNANQAQQIAEKLGMEYFFGRAIDYDGGQYGVAILSKYPLTETTVIPLPEDADPEAEDRVIALATVKLPGGLAVRFGSTHLDVRSKGNRDQQVRTINEMASKVKVPFIVAGDFNATPESASIVELDKVFTRTCINDCAPTIPVINPKKAIDFIAFTKNAPFKVVSQQVIPERYASDHLPVVATLSY